MPRTRLLRIYQCVNVVTFELHAKPITDVHTYTQTSQRENIISNLSMKTVYVIEKNALQLKTIVVVSKLLNPNIFSKYQISVFEK